MVGTGNENAGAILGLDMRARIARGGTWLRNTGFRLSSTAILLAASTFITGGAKCIAQARYRNIVNQRFRTISDGPQSALIVDVAAGANHSDTRAVVLKQYAQTRAANDPVVLRELAVMRKNGEIKRGRQFSMVDVALVRRGGVLAMNSPASAAAPPAVEGRSAAARTRSGGPPLTFSFPTSTASTSWTAAKASQLATLANALVNEFTSVLGAPAWSGTVTVLNSDPNLGKVNEILGALFIYDATSSSYEILLPTFSDSQTEFLAMAQAWHGPALIGYDAWEKGMSRAAAIIAAQDLKTYPGVGTAIDPANGFYYTPDYDILNQPALGNSTFTPPTIGSENGPSINPTQYGGMIIPRLQMSGSAWLKCYIENPGFFQSFNSAYYTAFAADPTVANDVTRLTTYASAALPTGVEGQSFNSWFQLQYVLDTSITIGAKLYAHSTATFPDAISSAPPGAAVYLIYYLTTPAGDENNLNGISQVVYWDYTFTNRLSLASFGSVTIADGFGTVAPYFQGIGGTPADQMRVAMDFPVNKEYVRVYFPAGLTGSQTSPNSFSGTVVGQDSGSLAATFNTGGTLNTINATVQQGAFGSTGNVGTGFSRATFILSQNGSPAVTFKRNMFIDTGNVTPIFQFAALGNTTTLSTTFQNGLQMVSLPLRPILDNIAVAMGADPARALIAQFRQDNTIGTDQYLRYPQLPAYQPGYAFWTNFPAVTAPPSPGIVGVPYDAVSQPNVSIALQFGWNQIGTPYNTALDVTANVQFQYLGGTVYGYADAVTNGLVAAGVIGYNPTTGYVDITNPSSSLFVQNLLEPWSGYWINCTEPDGVTMTYQSPTAGKATRAARSSQTYGTAAQGAWRMPLLLMDDQNYSSGVVIGQVSKATTTYNRATDTAMPPSGPAASGIALSLGAKQGFSATRGAPSSLMTDLRPLNQQSQWIVTASFPAASRSFTLAWADTALLPHGARLTLTDAVSGVQQVMNTSASYTFTPSAKETTRSFTIDVAPRSIGRPIVSNLYAVMPRIGGRAPASMTITFDLANSTSVESTIYLNGRTIRHLAQSGRAAATGTNQVLWDMKDDNGRNVSGGTYMIQVTARDTNGNQSRSIAPLIVVR